MMARIGPFATYLAFLLVEEGLSTWGGGLGNGDAGLWLYPLKTATVLAFLILCWRQYEELRLVPRPRADQLALAVGIGVLVYLAWVRLDWDWARQGQSGGYNPFEAGSGAPLLAAVRLLGATLVVPVMEELFWRSFLLRYLISPRFTSVPLGTVTPFSLGASVVLFGLEHDLWLAGMVAGAAYTLLLYRTGQLWLAILAHAVTNLVLGVHVLLTEEWGWW